MSRSALFFIVKKKHGYSSKLHDNTQFMTENQQNTIQFKSVFWTLIFKRPQNRLPRNLQKQQRNEATHSQFSETLGQTIETKKTTKHKHLTWFTLSTPKYWA